MTDQDSGNPTSRNIPLPIQRTVRQRCGFGCVICGMPLYEYEHMKGWANVKIHVTEEITLLCDKHHREKTSGLLPLQEVIDANRNPHNFKNGVSKPYNLHFSGDEANVTVGSNKFSRKYQGYGTVLIPISVDGIPLLGFIIGDHHLLLNLVIFDEFNHQVLHIKNNQLISSVRPWDIQLVGTKLTIREAQAKILVEIEFKPPSQILINRGRILCNGIEILIRPENILITNDSTVLINCESRNVTGGLIIGPHIENIPCCIRMENIPRYIGDRSEALKFEKECKNKYKS